MARPFVLALLLAVSRAVYAEGGLDLAILVDRSTSMARLDRTDVLLLRMTVDLIARNALANRVEHRLAVIGFGSSPDLDLPFTPVRPENLPWLRTRVDALPHEDRGDTDVLAAFVLAEQLFRALPASPERRRAIVLLTDGVPYVRGADMTAYRAKLQRFVAEHFAAGGITFDVLLVDARHASLWRGLASGLELAGRAPHQLLPRAYGVVAHLIGTPTAESKAAKANTASDTLVVPPYLDVIVFDIFRASRDAAVEVFPPRSGTPIRAGVDGVEAGAIGDVLATLVVPRPPPGEWIIRKSRPDARVRILSQQFFPRGVLLRPRQNEEIRQCDHVPLAYRALDATGHPLQELREYALALDVTLTRPAGASTAVAMERDPDLGTSGFRSAQDVACNVAGRYWTDVRITTIDAGGHRLDVFRDRWSGFSVAASPQSDCSTRRPLANGVHTAAMTNTLPSSTWMVVALLLGAIGIAGLTSRKTKS